uniref:Uncharacterized protein n=1 Tax=Acrobeloides nanus TaxID=290746 RepID=A0A914EHL7_9BILA
MSFSVREQSVKAKLKDSRKFKWFKKFKSGDTNLEDEEGRGRPFDFNDAALLETMEEDESLMTIMLAKQVDADHSVIVRRLKKLDKVWKLSGWVPHELSENNKAERVHILRNCLNESNSVKRW